MGQYTPDVTDEDVERIVRRDYPQDVHDFIFEMIRGIEVIEKARVVLACLKVGQGDVKKAEGELANASGWWREIILAAEYPNYAKIMFRVERLPREEVDRVIEKDKTQYLAWLNRP